MSDQGLETTNQPLTVDQFRQAQQDRRAREVRPATILDIEERRQIFQTLIETARNIPPNIPIRFHGCHAYDLEQIAQSGMLQSGADLTTGSTSFDLKGVISVTTPQTILTTVGDLEYSQKLIDSGKEVKQAGYIDILDVEIPLGCTFVVFPENEADAQKGENGGNVTKNVDLHGDRFSRLMVSSEFVNRAKGIFMMAGLDPNRVIQYTSLPDELSKIYDEVSQNFPYTRTYQPQAKAPGFSISL